MESESLDEPVANPRKLSENGQMAAIGIYGFLVLVGFFFGIVTGYEKPRPVVAKKDETTKKDEHVKKDTSVAPKAQPPKTTPNQPTGTVPNTQYTPEPDPKPKDDPKTEPDPKPEPKKDEPKPEEPKPEPKKVDPVPEPKKEEPKKEEPKKELVSAVTFKDVLPILREHCGNCHGAAGKAKADVDTTTYEKLMKSPSGIGKSVVAGDLKKSGLWVSIENLEMPPDGKPRPTPKQLETLKNWILAGAKPRRRTVRNKKA
ncbi:: PSCyt1 [Gemmataceae bacterium]|nr:: PSCyt1 [Gemmataceae bacterium]VTU02655.1 : PSCyt1 [Gemmataceae bacterium]